MASSAALSSSTLIESIAIHPHRYDFFKSKNNIRIPLLSSLKPLRTAVAVRAEFDMSIFGGEPPPPIENAPRFDDLESKEEPECPPGLRQYETMVILRPNISEDERIAFISKYEGLLINGGAMFVEVLNKGVRPLAYSIKKRNKAGETNTYLDSIQILFTYFTKPESILIVRETLERDDDVIRSSTFKIRKKKVLVKSIKH